jgi:hypothetical protein
VLSIVLHRKCESSVSPPLKLVNWKSAYHSKMGNEETLY